MEGQINRISERSAKPSADRQSPSCNILECPFSHVRDLCVLLKYMIIDRRNNTTTFGLAISLTEFFAFVHHGPRVIYRRKGGGERGVYFG